MEVARASNNSVDELFSYHNLAKAYVSPVAALTGRAKLDPGHPLAPRYVTRHQESRIRNTFPFLNLPAELRFMIYSHCVDLRSIQQNLDRYYHSFKNAVSPAEVDSPCVYRRTPNILVLNRQIYVEARTLVQEGAIEFDHGLLDLAFLNDFVVAPVLRTITSITVSDAGHDLFSGTQHPASSWYGYMELITQLNKVLAPPGHHLKSFTIDFTSKELATHIAVCWDATFVCGYRKSLKAALAPLHQVRAIGRVTFRGLPSLVAMELKSIMERPYLTFFCLPQEVRNKIYRLTASTSGVSKALNRTLSDPSYLPTRCITPKVLLLNRQIRDEALHHVRGLTIAPYTPHIFILGIPSILNFISIPTLQQIERLRIIIESWDCLGVLARLLPVLIEQHRLRSFYFEFKGIFTASVAPSEPLRLAHALRTHLAPLGEIRGLDEVTIVHHGNLPPYFADALRSLMLSKPAGGEIRPTLGFEHFIRPIVNLDGNEPMDVDSRLKV